MRIVSGEYRGRSIDAPEGQGTRPTTDRVRESLFSTLYSKLGGFDGLRVLDAFAGSGALGIESLSRGAAHVTFCEKDRRAAKVVENNLSKLGIERDRYSLRNSDVFASPLTGIHASFDLVFLDPPYATQQKDVSALVLGLHASGLISTGTLVCYEHDAKSDSSKLVDLLGENWRLGVSKKFGKTGISIFEAL